MVEQFEKFFHFVVCNPCQSSPSLTILVPLWFIIISLVFLYLCNVLFLGFLQFNTNFVNDQNTCNLKYHNCAPLKCAALCATEHEGEQEGEVSFA